VVFFMREHPWLMARERCADEMEDAPAPLRRPVCRLANP
jgi:hypothetical protein